MDHFTEITRTGYGTNIVNSFKGILFGLLLLIISIVLLWWNEGRSVEQANALKEMNAKTAVLDDTKYHAEYDNSPVCVYGQIEPLNKLEDTLFGITDNGLSLKRKVEMYQWKEHKSSRSEDKLGGDTETVTTYDYVKDWSSLEISSSMFKHQEGHHNPQMHYKSETFVSDAKLGEFHLSKSVVSHIYPSESYNGLSELPEQVGMAKNYKSFLYIGENPQQPYVGDIKITYFKASAGTFTVVAKELGNTLVTYRSTNDRDFLFIRHGNVPLEQIFKDELDSNATLTWVFRGVGVFLMFIGFTLIMGPLSALANVVPIFGSLVGAATGLIAAVLTLVLGSVIIALAWFGARPMMSLVILGVGISVAVGLGKLGKKKTLSSSSHGTVASTPPPRRDSTAPPSRKPS